MVIKNNAKPDVARLTQQARAALAAGRAPAAATLLDDALQRDPDDAQANILRALVYAGQRRFADAAPHLRRAVEICPADGNAWMLLGGALFETGHRDEALAALERACELAPRLAAAWYNLGRACRLAGRFDNADRALRRALELDRSHVSARLTLAEVEVIRGHVDAAVAQLRETLRASPGNARAWFGLANLKTYTFSAEDTVALQRAVAHGGVPENHQTLLTFALAKALDDQGDYRAAWQALGDANARDHRNYPWDRDQYRRSVTGLITAFENMSTSIPASERGGEVIFIVALPRSGSTLVEQVLASHPDVAGGNEVNALTDIVAEESKRRGGEVADWAGAATGADWERLGNLYLARTAHIRGHCVRFTDKSLGTWEYLGIVRRMLPGARFVHCRRDPLENCFSCYRQWFSQGCRFSSDLEDLASYYADYRRLMAFWETRRPGGVFDLSYDALLDAPEPTIRRLLAFCNLPYAAACLTPERSHRPVTSSASAAQVRQPMHRHTPATERYGALLDPLRKSLRSYGVT